MNAPAILHYDWAGGREAMLRFGDAGGPTVIAASALFEEANRTRAMLVDVLRRLAARGIGSLLPDLPGQHESPVPTIDARLAAWCQAFAAAAGLATGPLFVVAIRGGALVDTDVAAPRWHFSPLAGAEVVRALDRVRKAAGSADYAGNAIAPDMIAALREATPAPASTERLTTDPRDADRKLDARPMWHASEPDTDPALQATLADDIAAWIGTCDG